MPSLTQNQIKVLLFIFFILRFFKKDSINHTFHTENYINSNGSVLIKLNYSLYCYEQPFIEKWFKFKWPHVILYLILCLTLELRVKQSIEDCIQSVVMINAWYMYILVELYSFL